MGTMDVKLKKTTTTKKLFSKPAKDKKGSEDDSTSRFLITTNVLGSSGPLRFIVNKDDRASDVIDAALKMPAREKRLPVLGSDVNAFLLYPVNAGFDALSPWDSIGSKEVRNFVLCKKQMRPLMSEGILLHHHQKKRKNNVGGVLRAWLNKSFIFKNLSSSAQVTNSGLSPKAKN